MEGRRPIRYRFVPVSNSGKSRIAGDAVAARALNSTCPQSGNGMADAIDQAEQAAGRLQGSAASALSEAPRMSAPVSV
jgi:hypothetical protein